MQFYRLLEGEDLDFTASKGLLDHLKKIFSIRQITISVEALIGDKEGAPLFKDYIAELIQQEGISREQLHKCDKTGLNYKMFLTNTHA